MDSELKRFCPSVARGGGKEDTYRERYLIPFTERQDRIVCGKDIIQDIACRPDVHVSCGNPQSGPKGTVPYL